MFKRATSEDRSPPAMPGMATGKAKELPRRSNIEMKTFILEFLFRWDLGWDKRMKCQLCEHEEITR